MKDAKINIKLAEGVQIKMGVDEFMQGIETFQ